ncbi:hypothetical protein ACTHQF_07545 [Pedobacter sp. SAFR-022]|uniref:hypothetical protein n=1 Tax=Pedobacter sp. SAFR-022 TaxID=3436861 RepID=UPI003F7F1AC2
MMIIKALQTNNYNPISHKYEDKASITKLIFITWFILAVILCLVEASTLDVLPSLMQDEAQITDYGRLTLDPLSRWSVTWWVAGDKPLLLWSYLGPVFAELGYQFGGTSGVGPRIVALIGGLAAATVALAWLNQRKVPAAFAGLLSLAFLLDPLFTLSQRMARTDSWVIAFCLTSCWLLRLSSNKEGTTRILLVMLAGVLAALSAFVWPSALFLYPLILAEFLSSFYDGHFTRNSLQKTGKLFLYFVIGGLLTSILLLIPIRHQLTPIFEDMKNMVALNVNASKTSFERISGIFNYQSWAKIAKAFIKTLGPFLPLLGVWALFFRRERGIIIAFIFTLIIILTTLVYEFRLLYLLPYFMVLTGNLFLKAERKSVKPAVQRVSAGLLAFTVLWSICISVVLRSAFAYKDGAQRERNLIEAAARSAIGTGNHKVFLAFTYEFYFTGRSLGWEMYTPYIQFSFDDDGNWIRENDFKPKDRFMKLLAQMDYAIFSGSELDEDLSAQLRSSGLDYHGAIHIGMQQPKSNITSSDRSIGGIFSWYIQGAPSYGPYMLFARADKKARPSTILVQKSQ